MTMFKLQTIPIRNRSGGELELALEPEGDVLLLPPNADCQVSAEGDGSDVEDVELEYGIGRITIYASCWKRVIVGGVRVR